MNLYLNHNCILIIRKASWVILSLSFFTAANAQKFVKAGLNFNSAKITDLNTGDRLETGMNAGLKEFCLGVGTGFKIKEKINLQGSLDWTIKGYTDKFSGAPWDRNPFWNIYREYENYKTINRFIYVSLPLTASYIFEMNHFNLFVQGGGFGAIGITSREKIVGTHPEGGKREGDLYETFLTNTKSKSQPEVVGKKRGDRGVILGGGIEWDIFQIGLQYHHSTKNIARTDYELRNRSLCLYVAANISLNEAIGGDTRKLPTIHDR